MSPEPGILERVAGQDLLDEIEEGLRVHLARFGMIPCLHEVAEYALLGGGKRIRPILVLRCCEAVGGQRPDAVPAAVAFECVHAFSLVHDDLPAMDDDDLRRGRPTVHRAFSEPMAILAGDLLSVVAAEIAARSPRARAEVMMEVLAATRKMIEGQVLDTVGGFDSDDDPEANLRTVHRLKTGALIEGSCRAGALVGDADAAGLEAIDAYASSIGLLFQVVDDILDETQTTEHLGKTAGKDADSGKLTFPRVLGLDRSRQEVETLSASAIDALEPLGESADPLRELARYLATRTR